MATPTSNIVNQGEGQCTVCYERGNMLAHTPTAQGQELHFVCQACLNGIIQNSNPPRCPVCRANITHVNGIAVQQPQQRPAPAPAPAPRPQGDMPRGLHV